MRQNEVKIGMTAIAKIGSRYAEVNVLREARSATRVRRWVCLTSDTRREITATAARLHGLPGSPEARSAEAREQSRRDELGRRQQECQSRPAEPSPVPAAWDGHPGDAWLPLVPVPGLLPGLLPGRRESRVLRLSRANHAFLRRIVDREHVAEGMLRIARVVRRAIGERIVWRTIPRDLRRGVLFTAACIHFGNRETYTAVMGHAPLPSPRAVAEAVGVACGLGPMPR